MGGRIYLGSHFKEMESIMEEKVVVSGGEHVPHHIGSKKLAEKQG